MAGPTSLTNHLGGTPLGKLSAGISASGSAEGSPWQMLGLQMENENGRCLKRKSSSPRDDFTGFKRFYGECESR